MTQMTPASLIFGGRRDSEDCASTGTIETFERDVSIFDENDDASWVIDTFFGNDDESFPLILSDETDCATDHPTVSCAESQDERGESKATTPIIRALEQERPPSLPNRHATEPVPSFYRRDLEFTQRLESSSSAAAASSSSSQTETRPNVKPHFRPSSDVTSDSENVGENTTSSVARDDGTFGTKKSCVASDELISCVLREMRESRRSANNRTKTIPSLCQSHRRQPKVESALSVNEEKLPFLTKFCHGGVVARMESSSCRHDSESSRINHISSLANKFTRSRRIKDSRKDTPQGLPTYKSQPCCDVLQVQSSDRLAKKETCDENNTAQNTHRQPAPPLQRDRSKNQKDTRDNSTAMEHDNKPAICSISENDYLTGRGGHGSRQPGNQRARNLIQQLSFQYSETGSRALKIMIVDQVIEDIHSRGGRILKRLASKEGSWIECSLDESRVKVRQRFREETIAPQRPATVKAIQLAGLRRQVGRLPLAAFWSGREGLAYSCLRKDDREEITVDRVS